MEEDLSIVEAARSMGIPNYTSCSTAGLWEGGNGEDSGECDSDSGIPDIGYNSFAGRLEATASHIGTPTGASPCGGQQYITLVRAAFHIFKGNVGAGVFLLPTFYQDSGYLLGIVCVLVLGFIMIDCSGSLLHAKQSIGRSNVKTYPAVVGYVLGPYLKLFTQFTLIFTQFGFCVMFVQYASSMFAALFIGVNLYEVFVVLSIVMVTPMTFLSDRIALLGYVSVVAGVYVVLVLAGTAAVDVHNLVTLGLAPGVRAVIPTARLLVFLSGHMFALEGIGVVLPVENSIAPTEQHRFRSVVEQTLTWVVLLYASFGVLGYLAYGDALKTSVVLALPAGLFKQALEILLGLSLLLGYPIQYVPAIQLVDKALGVNEKTDRRQSYMVRVALNTAFGVTALCIGADTLNIFASFLGAAAGVHLMITVPALLSLQLGNALNGERRGRSTASYYLLMFRGPHSWRRSRYYVYLLLSGVICVGGIYYTLALVSQRAVTATTTTTTTEVPLPVPVAQ